MNKQNTIGKIGKGVLDLYDKYGFIRSYASNYLPSKEDIYISKNNILLYNLKDGDSITAEILPPKIGERNYWVNKIKEINGCDPDSLKRDIDFKSLIAISPNQKFKLAKKGCTVSTRIIDLFAPIGKGQRGLLVAPPKAGKTSILKDCAKCISKNHPEVYQIVLLIDERPEEVTDFKKNIKAEIIASTFDEPATKHIKISMMVLKKALRLVECGFDVVILLDSITRLTRAYNLVLPYTGKILTGGLDPKALIGPKEFFGSARKIEKGGSLTILATAIVETGSKMDDIIFEEFKGTGNMELKLDRRIANRRIFPAIDILNSGTRKDELLLDKKTLNKVSIIRNKIYKMNTIEAMQYVKNQIEITKNNTELLKLIN